ncbi:MAG: hypothetical protein QOK05_1606 [Chloroflexota bacterium]|nr:hypothetical protein [Chloroflexota bacterium]
MGFKRLIAAAMPATLLVFATGVSSPLPASAAPNITGSWSAPFEEPTGLYTEPAGPTEHCTKPDTAGYKQCKPTAVNASVLADGRVVYWNGLSDLENIQQNTVLEAGGVGDSSYARVLDLRPMVLQGKAPVFSTPSPANGAGPEPCDMPEACGASQFPLPGNNGPAPSMTGNGKGDHDMFCSDNLQLPDGRILVAGGTRWYQEPNVPGTPYGQAELQGLRLTQVFDPKTNTFTRMAPMNNGRWYPTLVLEGNGSVFVGGGVRKLIQTDGTNVKQTETFDPSANSVDPGDGKAVAGKWTVNPGGDAAMPLFPRYHLMPDGSIYYDASGQMWGPAGQSADEALYALHQSYDPSYTDPTTGSHWKVFGFGTYGARSGAFSVLLPLKTPYNQADVLTGGGTLGPPPGGYVSTNFSEVSHFTAAGGWTPTFSSGPQLTQQRWFSSTVTLPNDAVAVFSGANKDEVVDPGNESPVRMAEWYTPWDGQFHALSADSRDRTYHNTAILLPDASVLVGGHAPIAAHYGATSNTEHDATAGTPLATANNFRDPSFEIYRPPYLSAGDRPVIGRAPAGIAWGKSFSVQTKSAADITSIRLIRLPSLTHIVDANMRSVELPFTRHGNTLEVQAPPTGNIAPAGNYYLFINRGSGATSVPSTAAIVKLGSAVDNRAAVIPFGNGISAGHDAPKAAGTSAAAAPGAAAEGASAATGGGTATGVPTAINAVPISSRSAISLPATRWASLAVPLAGVAAGGLAAIAMRRRRRTG